MSPTPLTHPYQEAALNTMQLSCFVEVASTLNFSEAANNLHVSQPTVSHQIKSLEEELGCELVVRSTRSVALTDAGLSFLGYAYDILELTMRARRNLSGDEAPSSKRLRIGVNDGLEAQLISPVLAALYRDDAEFDPVIRMAPHAALVEMLENATVDVVLEYRDPAGAPAGATVFKRLFDAPAALVCSADHAIARCGAECIELAECASLGKLAVGNPREVASAIANMQRSLMDYVDPKQVMMCPNIEVAISLAAAGIAFTLLPDFSAMHREDLAFIPVDGVDAVTFGVRVRRGRMSKTLGNFISALTALNVK